MKKLIFTTSLMAGSAYASPCTDFGEQDFDKLDGRQVVAVCTKELSKDPNNAELQFVLGFGYDQLQNYA